MKYLPYENITYISKLDPKEIIKKLGDVVEPKRSILMSGQPRKNSFKKFEGKINGNTFIIKRIINYTNSVRPVIEGEILGELNGSKINVVIRLQIDIVVFFAVWFIGIGVFFIYVLYNCIENKAFDPTVLVPLGMLIFCYGLIIGTYNFEGSESKKCLTELFESEIVKETLFIK